MFSDILQPTHLLFVLVVALLVLGPKRLPEVGRALGRGLRDFRNALSTDELHEQMISTTSATAPPTSATAPPTSEPQSEPTDTPTSGEAVSASRTQAAPATSDTSASSSEPEPAVSAPGQDPTP